MPIAGYAERSGAMCCRIGIGGQRRLRTGFLRGLRDVSPRVVQELPVRQPGRASHCQTVPASAFHKQVTQESRSLLTCTAHCWRMHCRLPPELTDALYAATEAAAGDQALVETGTTTPVGALLSRSLLGPCASARLHEVSHTCTLHCRHQRLDKGEHHAPRLPERGFESD